MIGGLSPSRLESRPGMGAEEGESVRASVDTGLGGTTVVVAAG